MSITFHLEEHSLGIVVTTSPTCSRQRIVVFPAPSNPKIKILISRVPNKLEKMVEKKPPTKKNVTITLFRVSNNVSIANLQNQEAQYCSQTIHLS